MADTTTEVLTEVNKTSDRRRVDFSLSAADEARIQQAVCRANRRPFSIVGAVLGITLLAGAIAVTAVSDWIGEVSREQTAQRATMDSSARHLAALEADVVRKAQLEMVQQQVRELEGVARSLNGNIHEVRRQQDRIDSVIGALSSAVSSITAKVGEEQAARVELMEAINRLGTQLRQGQGDPGG